MPHRRPLFDVALGTLTGKGADPGDISGALCHADRPTGIEQIEEVRRLDTELVGRERQPLVAIPKQLLAFSLERLKRSHEHRDVAFFEIIGGELNFGFVVDISVRD